MCITTAVAEEVSLDRRSVALRNHRRWDSTIGTHLLVSWTYLSAEVPKLVHFGVDSLLDIADNSGRAAMLVLVVCSR